MRTSSNQINQDHQWYQSANFYKVQLVQQHQVLLFCVFFKKTITIVRLRLSIVPSVSMFLWFLPTSLPGTSAKVSPPRAQTSRTVGTYNLSSKGHSNMNLWSAGSRLATSEIISIRLSTIWAFYRNQYQCQSVSVNIMYRYRYRDRYHLSLSCLCLYQCPCLACRIPISHYHCVAHQWWSLLHCQAIYWAGDQGHWFCQSKPRSSKQ